MHATRGKMRARDAGAFGLCETGVGNRMTPPIIVAEDANNVLVFRCVGDATAYTEAIDVDDGIYQAWDSDGRALIFTTDPPRGSPTSRRVSLSLGEPAHFDSEEVANLLRGVLERVAKRRAAGTSLRAVLEEYMSWAGYAR